MTETADTSSTHAPGQSSAAQTTSVVASSGTHAAACTPSRPGRGPGRRQSASPGSRAVPQAKQVGKGWSSSPA